MIFMDLPTLISKLDSSNLTRTLLSSNKGDIVSYVNESNTQTVNCSINSTSYSNATSLCLVAGDSSIYLYIVCNRQKYYKKIAISSINSIVFS